MGLLDNDLSLLGLNILNSNYGKYGRLGPALTQGIGGYMSSKAAMRDRAMKEEQAKQKQAMALAQQKLQEQQLQQQLEQYRQKKNAIAALPAGVRPYIQADAMDAYKATHPAPKKREMYKGADGYNYWKDTNERVNPSIEAKTASPLVNVDMGKGESSLWKQIGPMAKEKQSAAKLALKDYQAADRIQKVLDSGIYRAGPGATVQSYLDQIAAKYGGGSKYVKNTRTVIQGLAQTAVGARKMLQGQGQVTENEAKAVEKINSGQYEDLTNDELQLVVNLIRKASKYTANDYQDFMDNMKRDFPANAPYFNVRGLDPVLKWEDPGFKANTPDRGWQIKEIK